MRKNRSTPAPQPLFDTLENLIEENRHHVLPVTLKGKPDWCIKDYEITRQFLLEYKGSIDTFNSYRRECERLLQWCFVVEQSGLPALTREAILAYVEFCESPPLTWIGEYNTVARFETRAGLRQPNSAWRPFTARLTKAQFSNAQSPNIKQFNLSNNAMKALFRVLSSFFRYLYEEDYVAANPVAKIRQKSRFIKKTPESRLNRTLTDLQWHYVIETAQQLAENNPEKHERTLFVMSALFAMYLRVSEFAETPRWSPQMNHFFRDAVGNWWFRTIGKGNKEREVSVSDDMLESLKRYRQFLGLSALPSAQDNSPILPRARGGGGIASTRQVRRIVQTCFDATAMRLRRDGFDEDADQLQAATVHWMRHTGISHDVQSRQREHVRDDAGHSSSAITDLYIDVDKKARHLSGKSKKLIPDEGE